MLENELQKKSLFYIERSAVVPLFQTREQARAAAADPQKLLGLTI
jgi:hypothetical protein